MNDKLAINLKKEPFPHLIIDDCLTPGELQKVGQEVDYLYLQNLSKDSFTSAKVAGFADGSVKSKAHYKVIYLTQIFTCQNNTVIGSLVDDLLRQGLLTLFSQVEPWAITLGSKKHTVEIKINLYDCGDKYERHTDGSYFTLLYYYYEDPKPFTGGNLIFPDHGLTYSCKHNSLILFPGHISHEVEEVKSVNPDKKKGIRTAINVFISPPNPQ